MKGIEKNTGLSERIRQVALEKYVQPNAQARRNFSIAVRSLLRDLQETEFPSGHTPQVCSAIQSRKFLLENALNIERVDGPPSKQSSTVVIHYCFQQDGPEQVQPDSADEFAQESSGERAVRLAREATGLLQGAVSRFGSAEALLRWIRSEEAE